MAVPNSDIAHQHLADVIADWERGRSSIQVLEGGGGSLTRVPFRVDKRVTLIDISPEQLERNTTAHEKILGDLHEVPFGTAKYDAAVCYNVIEHLANPGYVIEKLCAAVRSGGLVILAAPNPLSLPGRITKLTPHWFHVLVLKHLLKVENAGKPGYPPFPTIYHPDMYPDRLREIASHIGTEIVYFECYESERRAYLRQRSPVFGRLFDAAIAIGNTVSNQPLEASDMFVVLKKN